MFAFVLLIAVASAMDFKTWAAKHNKHYTAAEALRRRAIFNKNARFVAQHNRMNKNFKLSVEGPFAAMTNEEYRKLLTVYDKPEAATFEYTATDLKASSVDWRSSNKVTAVRDQGSCGSCYAFASIAALESRLLISGTSFTKSNLDLSEQQIVDCSTMNSGCDGGSLVYTYNYLKNNGVTTEAKYAYTETAGTCKSFTKAVKVGGSVHVTATEAALTSALGDGPVAVCIDASTIKFQLYSSGVFDDSNCSSTINHGVTAVGYGTQNGSDYYIVKNSWGTSWGDAGYILMSRNKNNQCAIASTCYYPTGVADA